MADESGILAKLLEINGDQLVAITALGSAAISGSIALVGAYLSNRQSQQRSQVERDHAIKTEARELRRQKIEESALHAARWSRSMMDLTDLHLSTMNSQLNINDPLWDDAATNLEATNFDRAIVLLVLYFNEERDLLDAIQDTRSEFSKLVRTNASYVKRYHHGNQRIKSELIAARTQLVANANSISKALTTRMLSEVGTEPGASLK